MTASVRLLVLVALLAIAFNLAVKLVAAIGIWKFVFAG